MKPNLQMHCRGKVAPVSTEKIDAWLRKHKRTHPRVMKCLSHPGPGVRHLNAEDKTNQLSEKEKLSVAQGALAQAVQEHREWVKFDNMTQEHGPALSRGFSVLFLISLPSFQPWIPEPEFALLAAESELGLGGGASCGILQILGS